MSAWGTKPASGAWANAVEEEEQEHGAIQAPVVAPERDFPSLGAAAVIKESKKEKKKKQTMSLGDFMSAGRSSRFADPVLDLPTAPRPREPGEEDSGPQLGGAFRAYGGDRYGGGGRGGRFDEDRPPRRRDDEEDMGPSRADAASDWGAERKFAPSDRDAGGFRDRGGFGGGFRDREPRSPRREFEDGPSRADTGDWGARQFVPSSEGPRGGGGGGGFRDREPRSPRSPREPSRADVEERWERRGAAPPTGFDDRPRRGFEDAPRERRGFSDGWRGREAAAGSGPSSRDGSRDVWRREGPPPGPDDAPRERPKLVLKPRTEEPAPGPDAEGAPAPAPAARPSIFGAARPREEVLKEQGRDATREDERLEAAAKTSTRMPPRGKDSEEVAAAKAKLAEARAAAEAAGEDAEAKAKAEEEVQALEAELEKLSVEGRGRGGERREGGDRREANGRSGSQRRDGGGFQRRDDREASGTRGGDRW